MLMTSNEQAEGLPQVPMIPHEFLRMAEYYQKKKKQYRQMMIATISKMISRKAMLMVAATLFTLPLAEAVTVLNSTISSTRLLSPISSGFKSSGFNSSITRKPTPASSIRGSSFATTRFNSSTYPSSIDCKIQSEISIEELLIMIRPNISLMSEPETLAYLALLGEELYTVGSLFEEAGTLSAKSQMFTDKVAYTSILSSIQVKANKVITRALGPNGDAVLAGFSYVANACLFSTCTNQYSSQSSVVVAGGGNWDGVWAYIPQSPCCGGKLRI
ncbi:hypothetical protein BGZ60DRAFT_286101 [Tricladium varicosporioides]|nr:hypothetical protein BGZ60DRAFT_286101 [Hymenoscyphus varicosporioides]